MTNNEKFERDVNRRTFLEPVGSFVVPERIIEEARNAAGFCFIIALIGARKPVI